MLLNDAVGARKRAASATSRSCTWCGASPCFRTTLPTTASTACCRASTSPPSSSSASKSSAGANTFLNGTAPGGSGVGGAINLLPKRAPNEPLTRVGAGVQSGGEGYVAADIARRFGPDQSTGIRLNAVRRDGGTGVDDESRELSARRPGLRLAQPQRALVGRHRLAGTRPQGRPPERDALRRRCRSRTRRMLGRTSRNRGPTRRSATPSAPCAASSTSPTASPPGPPPARGAARKPTRWRIRHSSTALGNMTSFRFDNVRKDEVSHRRDRRARASSPPALWVTR